MSGSWAPQSGHPACHLHHHDLGGDQESVCSCGCLSVCDSVPAHSQCMTQNYTDSNWLWEKILNYLLQLVCSSLAVKCKTSRLSQTGTYCAHNSHWESIAVYRKDHVIIFQWPRSFLWRNVVEWRFIHVEDLASIPDMLCNCDSKVCSLLIDAACVDQCVPISPLQWPILYIWGLVELLQYVFADADIIPGFDELHTLYYTIWAPLLQCLWVQQNLSHRAGQHREAWSWLPLKAIQIKPTLFKFANYPPYRIGRHAKHSSDVSHSKCALIKLCSWTEVDAYDQSLLVWGIHHSYSLYLLDNLHGIVLYPFGRYTSLNEVF